MWWWWDRGEGVLADLGGRTVGQSQEVVTVYLTHSFPPTGPPLSSNYCVCFREQDSIGATMGPSETHRVFGLNHGPVCRGTLFDRGDDRSSHRDCLYEDRSR